MTELAAESTWGAGDEESTHREVGRMLLRYLCFVCGLLINSFGLAFITKAALGTSPVSSIPYVLDLAFVPTFGETTFAINTLYIIAQAVMLRRDFRPIQYLQIVANLLFSVFIDVSMGILGWLNPTTLPACVVSLAIGCCILAFGISVEVAPNVIVVPGEGMVRAIATKVRRPFGTCKLCFDATLVAIACGMSFVFFGHLNGLGAGTVISALIVGPICNLIAAHVPLIDMIRSLVPEHETEAAAA